MQVKQNTAGVPVLPAWAIRAYLVLIQYLLVSLDDGVQLDIPNCIARRARAVYFLLDSWDHLASLDPPVSSCLMLIVGQELFLKNK